MRKFLIVCLLTISSMLMISGCGADSSQASGGDTGTSEIVTTTTAGPSPEAVVTVNGKEITRTDLAYAMEELKQQASEQAQQFPAPGTDRYADMEKQVVERLATEETIWFEASKMGLSVSDAEIDDNINQIKAQVGGESQFQAQLATQNLSMEGLRKDVWKSVLFEKVYAQVTNGVAEANQHDAFDKWVEQKKANYVIIYAPGMQPTATTATTG